MTNIDLSNLGWYKKDIPVPKEVTDFLAKNKGSTVKSHYDSSQGIWVYEFLKKGDSKLPTDSCIECKKQGLTIASHCIECMHCYVHCHGEVEIDCICCCVDAHCDTCTWHPSDLDCDLFECACCCNKHCIQCGHDSEDLCTEEGFKCSCCGCYTDKKLNVKKANNVNDVWLKVLVGNHSNKIDPKHLGPKDILKDIGKFYILFGHGDKSMIDAHKKMLAKYLLNYLMVSCAGEARHTLSKTHGDITKLSQMSQTLLVAKDKNADLLNRQYMWSAIYDLSEVSGCEVIMESLEELFNLDWITGSYGGKKWAKIAELAKNYCKGDYTESIFIDGIMNVVHNGGWAFNKYYKAQSGGNYYNPGISMMKLLDFKKEATLKSIYSLLVPLGIPKDGNESLWKKALEYGVIDETGELTSEYGVVFEKEGKKKKSGIYSDYYTTTKKVSIPSAAYIQYVKQHTKEVTVVA